MARSAASTRSISFPRLMLTSIAARLMSDSTTQMFNPFLPIFAAGLGVDLVVMGRLVSLRSAVGLVAPLLGALADRHGYRRVMRGGLVTAALGLLIVAGSTAVWQAALGMACTGLGLTAFVPTLQAYLSSRLPYAQRARGMGILEYSWALTGIVGLSLMGILIDATGWRSPFYVLAGGMMVMAWVFGALPAAHHSAGLSPHSAAADAPLWSRLRGFFQLGERAGQTYILIAAVAANFFAAILLMIVHGAWLADQYGLGPRQLGTVALLFGCFDLSASVSVSLFTDRFGKRRSVLLGTAGSLAAYLLLPWLNVALVPAVLAAATARGFFEFAIVSSLPLVSEQVPSQRAKVMTLSAAATLAASTVGSFVAPALYERTGITGVVLLSALFGAASLLLLLGRVREVEANG